LAKIFCRFFGGGGWVDDLVNNLQFAYKNNFWVVIIEQLTREIKYQTQPRGPPRKAGNGGDTVIYTSHLTPPPPLWFMSLSDEPLRGFYHKMKWWQRKIKRKTAKVKVVTKKFDFGMRRDTY
jgi:hypothetical protein